MMEQSGSTPLPAAQSVQPRGAWRWPLLGALLLVLIGIGVGGWTMRTYLSSQSAKAASQLSVSRTATNQPVVDLPAATAPRAGAGAVTEAGPIDLTERVTALEARLAALDMTADSVNGNAARAESLLIVFSVRRALDRGIALGALENQLRLHFGDAQPNAVSSVIQAARTPVTLERLQQQFDLLVPALQGKQGHSAGLWSSFKQEVSELFIFRRTDAPSPRIDARLAQVRRLLDAGSVERASREVATLPSAKLAANWLAEARRYQEARRALDLIEMAAILAPHSSATAPTEAATAPTAPTL